MGTLDAFKPSDFSCNVFFETGTGTGYSLGKALDAGCFQKLYSVEIDAETYQYVTQRFREVRNLTLLCSESPSALRAVLPSLATDDRVLFFLDAHFPGEVTNSFAGYKADVPEHKRLPLELELSVIAEVRANSHDVIIVDDLRIYENGPFEDGAMPAYAETLPPERKNIDFVTRLFPKARIARDYRNQGYLLIHT